MNGVMPDRAEVNAGLSLKRLIEAASSDGESSAIIRRNMKDEKETGRDLFERARGIYARGRRRFARRAAGII